MVKQCLKKFRYVFCVNNHYGTRWSELPSGFSAVILDFMTLQRLQSMTVQNLQAVPLPVLLRLIPDVPRLLSVSVYGVYGPEIGAIELPPASSIYSLNLDSTAITELLARPQFAPRTARLRHLAISYKASLLFVSRAAHTLEHIRLNCRPFGPSTLHGPLPPITPFPPLPSLRSIELHLHAARLDGQRTTDIISHILSCDSIPKFKPSSGRTQHHVRDELRANPQLLQTAVQSLADSAGRAVFRPSRTATDSLETGICGCRLRIDFARLMAMIEAKMPRLRAAGKLLFEPWRYHGFSPEWLATP
ncbi:hypothetical protein C8R43DRAFT_959428 [Mycena crocata]|nr:hypothetical protein C8R43DRAFT_959428 [Mycena crocata]